MPREKHPIWHKFIEIKGSSYVKAQCKLCNDIIAGNASRMKDHYDSCRKIYKPDVDDDANKMEVMCK